VPLTSPVVRASQSTEAVGRVARLDGRTRVIAVFRNGEWERVQGRSWFTPTTVQHLKAQDVRTVVLRRGFRRAQMPLSWVAEWRLRHRPGHDTHPAD
jgi:hypothetical protein